MAAPRAECKNLFAILAELRRTWRASGALWLRFFGKSFHAKNFGYDVMYVRPYRLSGWGGRRTSGAGVFGQYSLVGNRVTAFHLATRVFLAGNHISDEQRDKEQESQRKAKEPETRGDKI